MAVQIIILYVFFNNRSVTYCRYDVSAIPPTFTQACLLDARTPSGGRTVRVLLPVFTLCPLRWDRRVRSAQVKPTDADHIRRCSQSTRTERVHVPASTLRQMCLVRWVHSDHTRRCSQWTRTLLGGLLSDPLLSTSLVLIGVIA